MIEQKLEEYKVENKHALLLYDSVMEAQRQASIEMRDSKYLKDEDGGDGKDDAEQNADMNLFKKNTHKSSKFAHTKGFQGKSFARKRKRIE